MAAPRGRAGLLEPMDSSLREVWGRPGGWQHPAVHGPDLMVSLFDDRGAPFRLVANDIVTGEQRWDVALPEVAVFEAVGCRALGADVSEVSTHIVCRLDVPAAPGAELPACGPGSEARLVVFDARTDATVGDRSLDYGFGTVETLGSDILVTTVLADGRVQERREDPLTGRVRWAVESEQPLPGAGSGPGPQAPETTIEHGVIALSSPMAMALSEEGEVLGEWPAEGVQATALPLELAVDDGSASDLLLTTSEGSDASEQIPPARPPPDHHRRERPGRAGHQHRQAPVDRCERSAGRTRPAHRWSRRARPDRGQRGVDPHGGRHH